MSRNLIIALLIFTNANVFGQRIELLQNLIDSLALEENYKKLVQLSSEQKRLVDLQHYEIIYAQHGSHEDKITRILAYKSIRKLQYFLYRDDLFVKAKDLYVVATQKLISEYADDVKYLQALEITPSVRLTLWPILRKTIEDAGGKWERGEIPPIPIGGIPIRGNLIPEEEGEEN